MILASLVFYSLLDVRHLGVLIFSAAFNYAIGAALTYRINALKNTQSWLIAGIGFNLALLGGYKYIGFAAQLAGIDIPPVAAPLGISFFTFHQLAYLIDIHRRRIRPSGMRDYALYVTFFPHLIAGPIMRYGQFAPQLSPPARTIAYGAGLFFFSVGLFKKTVLADTFAPISDRIFAVAATSSGVERLEAWKGALAYAWQIYFDFSGYADMAIGLGLLLGIALPINFDSPYKATSMADFWRRWHITLSQFLRDYIYIPLGGSRHGKIRQSAALLVTMSLAGLWHGAAWTFVVWGTLHGAFLAMVHGWRWGPGRRIIFPRLVSIGMTFASVTLLWVLFRAENWENAMHYYHAMFAYPAPVSLPLNAMEWLSNAVWREWLWIGAGGLVIFALKPAAHWVGYDHDTHVIERLDVTWRHAIISGILLWISFKAMSGEPSRSFVYFVF
ncbi:MBOAT family O-acyltransferase [Sulfuricurvum sp.]|uniref:MBOAT family O-acyltransferase n=1 Tax=Sulfuricurvum sp. TaxID=2025608 RepID=UPI0026163DCB|nr:MBOAT family O-acyltransferase [Sulfuricurvum sp.]MDD2266025.1 MBOAT family protein [Sulfuricurvum sp.]